VEFICSKTKVRPIHSISVILTIMVGRSDLILLLLLLLIMVISSLVNVHTEIFSSMFKFGHFHMEQQLPKTSFPEMLPKEIHFISLCVGPSNCLVVCAPC